jgi:hypothetical protein
MKFTRTVKITRTRREVIVPAEGQNRCPNCGSELPAPLVPGMPLPASIDLIPQTVPEPPEEKQ